MKVLNAHKLFTQKIEFEIGATHPNHFPATQGLPEFAFWGRSNVGKSSLLNSLVGQQKLARTSVTPGRTQQINFFNLSHALYLVDLPGYGYAATSRHAIKSWMALISVYVSSHRALRRLFLLIDARHGLKDSDREVMDFLDQIPLSYHLLLTKADKVKQGSTTGSTDVRSLEQELRTRPAAYPQILVTSSEKGLGIEALRETIFSLWHTL